MAKIQQTSDEWYVRTFHGPRSLTAPTSLEIRRLAGDVHGVLFEGFCGRCHGISFCTLASGLWGAYSNLRL